MANNYYVVLGIGHDATQDEIKSAYRREAKKCHPDCSGEGSEPFLLVRDAYEALSDPRRRRAHDEELARERRRGSRTVGVPGSAQGWAGRPPVEPARPSRQAGYARGRYEQPPISSVFDEFFGRAEPRRAVEELHADVSLTRRQALHGGRVRIWLPVQIPCPACRGRGWDGFFECSFCRGSGTLVDERALDVAFPGGVYDGFTGNVSLRLLGLHELSLVLHFWIDG